MYSTVLEVGKSIKKDAVRSIVGGETKLEEEELNKKFYTIIKAAITDADAEIDGYINKRYKVPLKNPSKMVNKISKDIALYNIFSRMGIDEDSRENTYYTRYKNAIRFLENVAKGLVELGEESDSSTAQKPITDYKVSSNKRIFNRDSMKGM